MNEYIDKLIKYKNETKEYIAGFVEGYTAKDTIDSPPSDVNYLPKLDDTLESYYKEVYKTTKEEEKYETHIPEFEEEQETIKPKEEIKKEVKKPTYNEARAINVKESTKLQEQPKEKIKEQPKEMKVIPPTKIETLSEKNNKNWYEQGFNDGKTVKTYNYLIMLLVGFLICFGLYMLIEGFTVF